MTSLSEEIEYLGLSISLAGLFYLLLFAVPELLIEFEGMPAKMHLFIAVIVELIAFAILKIGFGLQTLHHIHMSEGLYLPEKKTTPVRRKPEQVNPYIYHQ